MARMGRNARRRADKRHRDDRWVTKHVTDAPVGPDVVIPDPETVLRAIEAAPALNDWSAVRSLVIPVLPRARPDPPGYPPPLRRLLSPGVVVGFGVDIGPAFMIVTEEQCAVMGVSIADLVAQALANLGARADLVRPEELYRDEENGAVIAALQTGRSIASTLLLVPDQLRRLFGPQPRLFVAPMRDVLLGFPADTDLAVAAWWFEEIASEDPNHLQPMAFRFDGERVTVQPLDDGLAPLTAIA